MIRTCAVVVVTLALAACGGKSSSSSTPTDPVGEPGAGGGRMAGPGTVLGDPAVYALLTESTLPLPVGQKDMPCAGDEATLGAQVQAWQKSMAGSINANCDGNHCAVSINAPIDPSCDTNRDQEGCDGSAYQIEFDRDDKGAVIADSLMCMSAG